MKRTLIYKNKKGERKMFVIEAPEPENVFGNKKEDQQEVGFKAKVYNREPNYKDEAVRSFRYDGIIALA